MQEYLNIDYYFDKNGDWIEFVRMLSCTDACRYFAIKKKIEIFDEPYHLFLRDITFSLTVTREDKIHDINFIDNAMDNQYIKVKYQNGKGLETYETIKKLVKKGEIVLIQPNVRLVPFWNNYEPDIPEPLPPGHTVVVVHIDDDNIYYVEGPWNIAYERFTPYKGNKSVGIIKKDELAPSFNAYLNYYIVDVNPDTLKPPQITDAIPILSNIVKNFEKVSNVKERMTIYYGRKAFQKLIELLKAENITMDSIVSFHKMRLWRFLNWKLNDILHGRRIVAGYFQQINHDGKYDCLNNHIKEHIVSWRNIINILFLREKRKENQIDSKIINFFTEALKNEEKIVKMIKEEIAIYVELNN